MSRTGAISDTPFGLVEALFDGGLPLVCFEDLGVADLPIVGERVHAVALPVAVDRLLAHAVGEQLLG